MNTIGIDVGAKELAVVVSVKGKARQAKTFNNTHQIITLLLNYYRH